MKQSNCDQDREASFFSKVKIAEVQDSVHVPEPEEGPRKKVLIYQCTGDWMEVT